MPVAGGFYAAFQALNNTPQIPVPFVLETYWCLRAFLPPICPPLYLFYGHVDAWTPFAAFPFGLLLALQTLSNRMVPRKGL